MSSILLPHFDPISGELEIIYSITQSTCSPDKYHFGIQTKHSSYYCIIDREQFIGILESTKDCQWYDEYRFAI